MIKRKTKLKLLDAATVGIFNFQCPRWSFTPTLAKRVDKFQTHLVGRLLRFPPIPYESKPAYFGRLHRAAARICSSRGKWSDLWIRRLQSWRDHIGRHPVCWSHAIFQHKNAAWLEQRRSNFNNSQSQSLTAGRTMTRCVRRRVHQRWETGFQLTPRD